MTAFGVPPRRAAVIALVLAILGAVGIIAGAFSAFEWIIVALLVIVAAVNWSRARNVEKGHG